jgi:hypothetical protein
VLVRGVVSSRWDHVDDLVAVFHRHLLRLAA